MSVPAEDRETTMGWDDSTSICQLITFNKALLNKLDKYCKQYPDTFKKTGDQIFDNIKEGSEYEFPKRLITIRTPKKKVMSDEQKLAASERMKKMKADEKVKKEKEKLEKVSKNKKVD